MMKRILLLLSVVAFASHSAWAQVFTLGKDGAVLENNAEITVTEVEDDGFGDLQMDANLYIKNAMMSNIYVKIEYVIESMSNGSMKICFPGSCVYKDQTGTFLTGGPDEMTPGDVKNVQTEWLPTEEGTCRIKYTIKRFNAAGTVPQGSGSTVTVNYVYGSSAVDNAQADEVVTVAYFDVLGRETAKPAKGLYIQQSTLRSGKVVTKKVLK